MFIVILLCSLTALVSAAAEERLVTLGGATTEIVFALGAGDQVVGVDQSSQYPAEARELPQVGYIRAISAEGVLALEPTLVITTSAIGPRNAAEQIEATGVEMLTVEAPDSPETLYAAIRTIGQRLDRSERAQKLIADLRETFAQRSELGRPPRVVFLMQSPGQGDLTAAGTATKADAVIALAGGENVVQSHRGYRPLSAEAMIVLQPDVILIGQIEGMPGGPPSLDGAQWRRVPAVANDQVHEVPLGRTLGFGIRSAEAILSLNRLFAEATR
ncbi:MAG: hemin ABC transporter substrate-binding protein [Opitutales bacterium]